jgi:formate dehydrogenase maturation protein FdhE
MKWVAGGRIRSRVETGSLQLSLFDFKGEAHGDIDAIRTNGERHWREFLPKMVAELESTGQLHSQLLKAEEQTDEDLDSMRRHLIQQGLTAQQAHDRAWEMVRERYLFLPPEQ